MRKVLYEELLRKTLQRLGDAGCFLVVGMDHNASWKNKTVCSEKISG